MQFFCVEGKDTKLRDSEFQSHVDMPANIGTELGLSVGLSTIMSKVDEDNNLKLRPVQLDLLPLRPVARKAAVERNFVSSASLDLQNSWQTLDLRSRKNSLPGKTEVDVNERPATDDFEHFTVAPTTDSNITSLFQCDALRNEWSSTKKGRETVQEFDAEHDYRSTFEMNSSRGASDEEEGGNSRKKLRLSKEQSALLEENFKEQSTLNPKRKNALAKQSNLTPRQVEVWFQNRRARTKLKQTEVDCELLKCCWENLTEENRRLHQELQDLRALKVAKPCVITHDFRVPLPATALTMCPSCERLTEAAKTSNAGFPNSGFRKHAKFSAAY